MTNAEFSNEFDVLYNSITSNQAPGLDEYEKSVFLTKAQDEIVKSYFNPRSNKTQEGFDGSEKRQIDFSMIMRSINLYTTEEVRIELIPYGGGVPYIGLIPGVNLKRPIQTSDNICLMTDTAPGIEDNKVKLYLHNNEGTLDNLKKILNGYSFSEPTTEQGKTIIIATPNKFGASVFDMREETRTVSLDKDILMFINEYIEVNRHGQTTRLTVLPINYTEYSRLMSKPYKRPLKNQAWRLLDNSGNSNLAELVVGPGDIITKYAMRYIKRPRAIILRALEDVTLDGIYGLDENGNPVKPEDSVMATRGVECELDPILHPEILQRGVELAKAAYTGDLQSQLTLGQASQTSVGAIQTSK